MAHNPLAWIGLAGVDAEDNPRARLWEKRLHWAMVAIAMLALPAYMFDAAGPQSRWHGVAVILDAVIFLAFLAELVWMMHLSNHPGRYLAENWLNVLILLGSLASILGATSNWIAIVRVLRVALGGMVLARLLTQFRVLFTRKGAPMLVGAAFAIMLCSGAMLYWLEPTIHSYWDGLWLAFVTGATIGYGDVVPTTGASRVFAAFTALVGVSLIALFTANIVAFFIGGEEAQMRKDLQHAVAELEAQLRRLLDSDDARIREELHRDIKELRHELAQLIHTDEAQLRKEFAHELGRLRADVAKLRDELAQRDAQDAPAAAGDERRA